MSSAAFSKEIRREKDALGNFVARSVGRQLMAREFREISRRGSFELVDFF